MKSRWLGFVATGLLLWSARILAETPQTATGADVDESRVTKTLYVDPAHTEAADDDKHGAVDLPFATFNYACQAAARAKDANVGVKVVLAAGTYREEATIPAPAKGKPDTDAPLVIEAAEREQAVIDGADTEGWSPSTWKVENDRWSHPFPFSRRFVKPHKPPVPADAPAYRPGDLVFVNGTPMRQVNTEAELKPGSFWVQAVRAAGVVSEGQPGANANVVVQPPEETPLDGAIVQMGMRPCGLKISGRRNVVVRGLLIQHVAGLGLGSAVGLDLSGCSNVLLEDVLSQWNDGRGLRVLDGENVTLSRVRALHNGDTGLDLIATKNLLVEDCEACFNFFRSEWGSWIDPRGTAAVSAANIRGGAWRRLHAIGNTGRGLLLRSGDHLTVEDSVLQGNAINGLAAEACGGPLWVRRCVVVGTKAAPVVAGKEIGGTGGVALTDSADVSLESNILANNAAVQLTWWEPDGVKPSGHAGKHTLQHNVLSGSDPGQLVCEMPGHDGPGGLELAFFRSLETDKNCFWNPASPDGFMLTSRPGTPPAVMDLTKWREALAGRAGPVPVGDPPGGLEAHSLWKDPLFADPAEGDYRLKGSSPVADWNLPSDEAVTGQ